MKTKFQEKWYQLRRVHSTFLYSITWIINNEFNIKVIKANWKKYKKNVPPIPLQRKCILSLCTKVVHLFPSAGIIENNKNQIGKMSIIGLDESWKLRTHKKLEAILSQLWSFTIPANMPNQETTSLKLFISVKQTYITKLDNMQQQMKIWELNDSHD